MSDKTRLEESQANITKLEKLIKEKRDNITKLEDSIEQSEEQAHINRALLLRLALRFKLRRQS